MLMWLDSMAFIAKKKMEYFLTNEEGDTNIVSMVVLMGIAVLLAVVFKDNVKNLLDNLFADIGTSASQAITNNTP